MSGPAVGFIGWIIPGSTRITGYDLNDARYFFKIGFYTPETAAGKSGCLGYGTRLHRFIFHLPLIAVACSATQYKKHHYIQEYISHDCPPIGQNQNSM